MEFESLPKGEDKTKKSDTTASYNISFRPESLRRTYSVSIFFDDKKELKLQYKIDLIFKKRTADYNAIIEIQRHQLFINGKKPDATAAELTAKCGDALYPLEIMTNERFDFLGITNHRVIEKRWDTFKKELQRSYQGNFVNSIIEETSKTLSNVTNIAQMIIQNDWFYVLFFNPLSNNSYGKEFPMLPYKKGFCIH